MPAARQQTEWVLADIAGFILPYSSGVTSRPLEDPPFKQFSELPQPLQSFILALGAAPLNTCKAAAAVLQQPIFTATWLTAATHYPLETAAVAQKWDALLHLLNSSSNSTQLQSKEPRLPAFLGLAAKHGRIDVVQMLIAKGAWGELCESQHMQVSRLPNSRAKPGHAQHAAGMYVWHPLIYAAESGRAEVVALLLSQPGVPVSARVGRCALCKAAEAGNNPIMQLLITSVQGLSAPGIGDNPLSAAAGAGHIPAVQFLLQQGAHPKNQHGTPYSKLSAPCPVTAALQYNRSAELIEHLLVQGIRWGTLEGLTRALECAAAAGKVQLVQVLLSSFPELTRSLACQAMCDAAWNKHTAVMRVWLETGSGVSHESISAAFLASAQVGSMEGLALLKQHGADVNMGWPATTPLLQAVLNDHAAAVQWLLDNGAAVELSHLLEAIESRAADAVRQLIQHGVRDKRNKALIKAAHTGFTDGVHLLLNAHLPAAPRRAAAVRAERLEVAHAAFCYGKAAVAKSRHELLQDDGHTALCDGAATTTTTTTTTSGCSCK
jgi:ankyrin repeat protein